jgi:hypothetical protein
MKGQHNKQKIDKKESGGNAGSVESEESQEQASHSFHEPLGISPTAARFPHSHRSGDESYLSSKQINTAGGGLRPSPKSYRVVVVDREK